MMAIEDIVTSNRCLLSTCWGILSGRQAVLSFRMMGGGS